MTIDITKLFAKLSCTGDGVARDYSASAAESGDAAGKDTWDKCRDDGTSYFRDLTDFFDCLAFARLGAVRDYAASFGAWSRTDIGSWDSADCLAFLLQDIASAVREWDAILHRDGDGTEEYWAEYNRQSEAGRVSGRLHSDTGDVVTYTIDN